MVGVTAGWGTDKHTKTCTGDKRPTMSERLVRPSEIAQLPDGTVIESLPECLWPNRYSGRRWEKRGDSIHALDMDPLTKSRDVVLLRYFLDPLPVKVVAS